jgi:hypothetical protein
LLFLLGLLLLNVFSSVVAAEAVALMVVEVVEVLTYPPL